MRTPLIRIYQRELTRLTRSEYRIGENQVRVTRFEKRRQKEIFRLVIQFRRSNVVRWSQYAPAVRVLPITRGY